jgi:hypothetical protein
MRMTLQFGARRRASTRPASKREDLPSWHAIGKRAQEGTGPATPPGMAAAGGLARNTWRQRAIAEPVARWSSSGTIAGGPKLES